MKYRIEFDGGTSCNVPRLGFGNGYGSYKINDEPVHRCHFNQPMSANTAELRTLEYAIQTIRDRGINVLESTLFIIGDSQIALGWASNPSRKLSKKATELFQDATARLQMAMRGFKKIEVSWQPRLKSVATFGH